MDRTQINKELDMLTLKNKLIITLKYYLFNTPQMECFYRILELLKKKYTDDINFLQDVRNQNYKDLNVAYEISNLIYYNCNNEYLLKDLLNSIDTGINFQLTNHQNVLSKLIIENTNITAETGNQVVCLREDIQSNAK